MHIGIGRGNEADIAASGFRRTDALELAGLEHAQQFRLLIERDVGDFIHEQRAAVGQLEPARAIGLRVGERALHMTEQFAFENALGQAAHIDDDERFARANRNGVQRAGDDAFARAVFTGDEHVGIRRTDAIDQFEDGPHGGRFGDERLAFAADAKQFVFRFEPLAFAQCFAEFDLVADDGGEPGVVPGLLDEVARAAAHCLDSQLDVGPGRHDHHGQRAVERLNAREQIEALLARSRVTGVIEVHQHDVEFVLLQCGEDFGRRTHRCCPVTFSFQQKTERLQHIGLVIGNQDTGVGLDHGWSMCQRTATPASFSLSGRYQAAARRNRSLIACHSVASGSASTTINWAPASSHRYNSA